MPAAVCTLYEKNYHLGVAALINSLERAGFRGDIFIGYRDQLPPWIGAIQDADNHPKIKLVASITIHFIFIATESHFTNYKPDFMLRLLNGEAKDCDALFYYDPDIIQLAPWSFMEQWVNAGICLCEDVNSPMYSSHPHRIFWRQYFGATGNASNEFQQYVNGGFIGLKKSEKDFLVTWQDLQNKMAPAIGDLSHSKIVDGAQQNHVDNPFLPFNASDQDALNATLEIAAPTVSIIGKEAMGFKHGANVMLHAIGNRKPWNVSYCQTFLRGIPPRQVDKAFWLNANGVIKLYANSFIKRKTLVLKITAFLARFYAKTK